MKKVLIFIFLGLISFLAGCKAKEEVINYDYENTLLIYLCGSNLESLRGSATKNVTELLKTEIPSDTKVLIMTGGAKKWRKYDINPDKNSIYEIKDQTLNLLLSSENKNMGEMETLKGFLDYGFDNARAKNTNLILWDHGGGGLGGVCFDENYTMDNLTLKELDTALKECKFTLNNQKFQMIGFDACLMANFETMFLVEKYAKHMVASEEIEPSGGWNYVNLIEYLNNFTYDKILEDYSLKCKRNKNEAYTLSHIDFSEYNELVAGFYEFVNKLNFLGNGFLKQVALAAEKAMAFGSNSEQEGYSDLIDLKALCVELNQTASDEVGKVNSLIEAMDVSVKSVYGEKRKGAGGISLYYPIHNVKSMVPLYLDLPVEETYLNFIKEFYLNLPEVTIEFVNKGVALPDGEIEIELTKPSIDYTFAVSYKLFRYETLADGSEKVYSLGYDADTIYDGNTKYKTSFGGKWMSYNGELINCSLIDKNDDVTVYSTPALVNDLKGSIRFTYNHNDETYEIDGFVQEAQGSELNRLEDINPDDVITLLYDDRTYDSKENLVKGKSFKYKDVKEGLKMMDIPAGKVKTYVTVTDIYGHEFRCCEAIYDWDGSKLVIKDLIIDK